MKFLKILGIALLILASLGLLLLALSPMFVAVDAFLGMEPVIICIALITLGFAISFIIKNPYIEKIFGYLLGSTILGVIIFYILGGPSSGIPLWIILVVVAAIVIPTFLTSLLKNVPFIGKKLVPFIWIISIFAAIMIIITNTVAK